MNLKDKDYKSITAASALLHDLGKFIRRAKIDKNYKHWEHSYKYIKDYFRGYKCLDDDTIDFIAYIAALHHKDELKKVSESIVKNINEAQNKKDKDKIKELEQRLDILKELKVCWDNLDKKQKKIVKSIIIGDSESASERKMFKSKSDEKKAKENGIGRDKRENTPLINIFSTLNIAMNNTKENYDIKSLPYFEPNSIIDYKNHEGEILNFKKEVSPKVKTNLIKFKEDLEQTKKFEKLITEDCINLWNFLLKKYTSFISSSLKERFKDISLYNHSKTTAATAICRYLDSKSYKEYYIVYGRIYDIQNYIYSGINANIEKPMQRIYTRSFLISLINVLIPNILVKKLGLYTFNILFCGGGTFNVLISKKEGMVDKAKECMQELKDEIETLFNNKIYLEYECEKIRIKTTKDRMRYEKGFKMAAMNLYEKKYNRTLNNLVFDDSKEYKKCQNCGINVVSTQIIENDNKKKLCSICSLEDKWMKFIKNDGIDKFYVDYNNAKIEDLNTPENFTKEKIKKGTPIICFSYDEAEKIKNEYPIIDVYDIGKTCIKKSYEKCQNCYGRDICDGPLKNNKETNQMVSLDCFSHMSSNDTIIATAKVDVDDFGFLLYHVYPRHIISEVYNFSISRLANTSSFFNLFFSMYLRKIIQDKFKDSVMILYAGGDDIMLTGNWEAVVDAVTCIKQELNNFIKVDVKNNATNKYENITITSGILFHNSKRPFSLVVQEVNKLLEEGKESGKNCTNLNGNILTYKQLDEVISMSNYLNKKVDDKLINRSILFKMYKLIKMVSSGDDIQKTRAYALFNYQVKSQLNEKKISKNNKIDEKIKQQLQKQIVEINKNLENLITSNKENNYPRYKYSKEKSIIEFSIRKSRKRDE